MPNRLLPRHWNAPSLLVAWIPPPINYDFGCSWIHLALETDEVSPNMQDGIPSFARTELRTTSCLFTRIATFLETTPGPVAATTTGS